jgi:hypothetical protein
MEGTPRIFPTRVNGWQDLASAMEFFRCLELGESGVKGREWVFRGVADAEDDPFLDEPESLRTTLDAAASEFDIRGIDIERLEIDLILEFIRRYHLNAVEAPPEKGETLEWLTLMRHYGVPSRLLDFTFSVFVAAYFAIERKGNRPAIWAVNKSWLSDEVPSIVEKDKDISEPFKQYLKFRRGNDFRGAFFKKPIDLVYPVNSFRLNQRLTIQQGLFLCPGDVTKTFAENLRSIPGHKDNVRQIPIEPSVRKPLLMALHRANINRATLFPGLDGFAQSLWTRSIWLKQLRAMEDAGARSKLNLDIDSLREH